jgi:diacylglycerol kinase (ATP)
MDRALTARKRAGETDTSGATPSHACDTETLQRTAMTPRPPSPPRSGQPGGQPGPHSANTPSRSSGGATRAAHAHDPRAPATAPASPASAPASAPGSAAGTTAADAQPGEAATNAPPVAAAPAEPPEPPHLHEPLGPDDPLAPLPFNPYKGNRGITRAWKALQYSIKGFRTAIREESAFRQELTLAAILVPIGVFVPVEPVERVLLLGSVMLVLIVELLNSSIENAVDRIGLERNELSGRAKDLGSAAVTVALLVCVMTWGLILVPHFGPPLLRWLGVM